MTNQERILDWMNRYGDECTLSVVTGTACPCSTARDSANPQYSLNWHRDNPSSAACNGTMLITRTTTTTTIKAVIHPPSVFANSIYAPKELLTALGEYQKDDMIYWGGINTTTLAIVDISGTNENRDYLTYKTINYSIRDVSKYYWQGTEVGQVSRLVRRG
jgi:hypothetical protein